MHFITRRWWLLAIAGAPVLLGIEARSLSVRVDDNYLRVNAPKMEFLTGKPLELLQDGKNVSYLGQLTIMTGADRVVRARSVAHFVISYDIWAETFKVTLVPSQWNAPESGKALSAANLTRNAAQAWCIEQLKIDFARVPGDRPLVIRLEMLSEGATKETAGIVGEPGISLNGLIDLFSHPPKGQQVHLTEEIQVDNLRKPHS